MSRKLPQLLAGSAFALLGMTLIAAWSGVMAPRPSGAAAPVFAFLDEGPDAYAPPPRTAIYSAGRARN
jgi:hypothetical protein